MRIHELAPLFAKELRKLNQQKLELLQDGDSVWLRALVTVVRLVGGEDHVGARLMLPSVQLHGDHAELGHYFFFVGILELIQIRPHLLLGLSHVWLEVLLVLRDDVFVPLRYDTFFPLRHNALIPLGYDSLGPLLLCAQSNRLRDGNGAINIWLDAFDVRRNGRVGQSVLEWWENVRFQDIFAIMVQTPAYWRLQRLICGTHRQRVYGEP